MSYQSTFKILIALSSFLFSSMFVSGQSLIEVDGPGFFKNKIGIGIDPEASIHIREPHNTSSGIVLQNSASGEIFGTFFSSSGYSKIYNRLLPIIGSSDLRIAIGPNESGLIDKAIFGNTSTNFTNEIIQNNGTTVLNGITRIRDDFYSPWGVTFYHDDLGFNEENQLRPWLKKGLKKRLSPFALNDKIMRYFPFTSVHDITSIVNRDMTINHAL